MDFLDNRDLLGLEWPMSGLTVALLLIAAFLLVALTVRLVQRR
jgi:hypothetical protein